MSSKSSKAISFRIKNSGPSEKAKSVASQFFEDPDTAGEMEGQNLAETVVELINQAQLYTKDNLKLDNLKKVQELVIHREPALLDNFIDEVIQFQQDRSTDVRKFVLGFIDEACTHDPQLIPSIVPHVRMVVGNPVEHVAVIKKAILCSSLLTKTALKWLAPMKSVTEEIEGCWMTLVDMRDRIKIMLDSENDGIRTHAIKFAESLVTAFSEKTADSEVMRGKENDFFLNQLPDEHPMIKKNELHSEGKVLFEALRSLLVTPSITSVNLMACLGSLSNIARQRPDFLSKVIQSFETLHVNLPPTLAKSQVSSVRKHMKMQLMILLKHPGAYNVISNVTTLLADLGVPDAEIKKHLPKIPENLKRSRPDDEDRNDKGKKKQKKEKLLADDEDDAGEGKSSEPAGVKRTVKTTVVDLLAEELKPLLGNGENVANLVLISMVSLPDTMPPQFQSAYTPIAAAGTETQVQHLARMMANQFSAVGIKPKNLEALKEVEQEEEEDKAVPPTPATEQESSTSLKGGIPVVGGQQSAEPVVTRKPVRNLPVIIPTGPRRITKFKLDDVTMAIPPDISQSFYVDTLSRIIKSKKQAQSGGVAAERIKILTGLASQFGGNSVPVLLKAVVEDIRGNVDLAIAWLYQEYSRSQGYMLRIVGHDENYYNELLCMFLGSMQKKPDQRDGLFYKLVMEAPVHTAESIKVIRSFCEDEVHFYAGMHALRELILKRPSMFGRYLQELLELTFHERTEVRSQAIQYVKRLYEREDLKEVIQDFAKQSLSYLLDSKPPLAIIQHLSSELQAKAAQEGWYEDLVKLCLYLFLALLPVNHKLIHDLGQVYVGAPATSKRTVLRVLETPVRGMGMESPELLLLVESCPKGAETLVTRMLHILTDKAPPTPELVKRVRDLYQKRVSDVRFLIPVLIGLDKKEVVAALPKLIKLNPIVVKEVFHRLLLSHQGDNSVGQSPLTPAELLISLHNIDHTKCDMKSIIKATSLCFNEKNIYTQEVLAVVIQKLMEQTPLPTLLMRTVIQSMAMYPRLSGFVMNILQRLIVKQVWKQPKVWEGFVKCCERTKPQSFNVLIQLPPLQLKQVFGMSLGIRELILNHVKSFTPHQQNHIPRATMALLETDPVVEAAERQRQERQRSEEASRRALQEQRQRDEVGEKKRREAERAEAERKRQLEDEMLKAKLAREKEAQQRVEQKVKAPGARGAPGALGAPSAISVVGAPPAAAISLMNVHEMLQAKLSQVKEAAQQNVEQKRAVSSAPSAISVVGAPSKAPTPGPDAPVQGMEKQEAPAAATTTIGTGAGEQKTAEGTLKNIPAATPTGRVTRSSSRLQTKK